MKNIVKLTYQDGLPIFINVLLIYDIYRNTNIEKANTTISFGNNYILMVNETPEEIIKLIYEL